MKTSPYSTSVREILKRETTLELGDLAKCKVVCEVQSDKCSQVTVDLTVLDGQWDAESLNGLIAMLAEALGTMRGEKPNPAPFAIPLEEPVAPSRFKTRMEFATSFLRQNRKATAPEVRSAWAEAGFTGTISDSTVSAARAKLNIRKS